MTSAAACDASIRRAESLPVACCRFSDGGWEGLSSRLFASSTSPIATFPSASLPTLRFSLASYNASYLPIAPCIPSIVFCLAFPFCVPGPVTRNSYPRRIPCASLVSAFRFRCWFLLAWPVPLCLPPRMIRFRKDTIVQKSSSTSRSGCFHLFTRVNST